MYQDEDKEDDDQGQHCECNDEEDDEDDDDGDVDSLCAEIRTGTQNARKRPRWVGVEGSDKNRYYSAEADAFDKLARARRQSDVRDGEGEKEKAADALNGRVNEVLYWSQGLVGMTADDAVSKDRPLELRRLLLLDPSMVNTALVFSVPGYGEGYLGATTLLQKAVHLGHYTCIDVLVAAGATGAIDILARTESTLRLDLLPHLLPGCTRKELRTMERSRLRDDKASIGFWLMRINPAAPTMWDIAPRQRPFTVFALKEAPALVKGDPERYIRTLWLWIEASGADDFRNGAGESLQDEAQQLKKWDVLYGLQRRCVFELLCIHYWRFNENPGLCRIPTVVLRNLIIPYLYRPAYCCHCGRGVGCRVVCPGCKTTPVPCSQCLHAARSSGYGRDNGAWPLCEGCEIPVCWSCINPCVASPVINDCTAVFCTSCFPRTCEDCVKTQTRREARLRDGRHPDEDSSDDDDEEEEEDDDDIERDEWGNPCRGESPSSSEDGEKDSSRSDGRGAEMQSPSREEKGHGHGDEEPVSGRQ